MLSNSARKFTGRTGLLYAEGAFHGLTCGALSLMGDAFWRDKFGPMLPDADAVPFGSLDALKAKLATGRYAGLFLEPVQSEAGIRVPDSGYLAAAADLCRRHGTLFVLDEVQTGMYRTGTFLAAHQFGVTPDIVVMAKALSGGLVPSSAVLMSEAVYRSVYDSLKRSIVHTSTFSENGLSMRAALATLDVLESEGLGLRTKELGEYLRERLRHTLSRYSMIAGIRGLGLLSGIVFQPPSELRLRLPFEAFRQHPSRHVRAGRGDAPVPRLEHSHSNVWEQFHGSESSAAVVVTEVADRSLRGGHRQRCGSDALVGRFLDRGPGSGAPRRERLTPRPTVAQMPIAALFLFVSATIPGALAQPTLLDQGYRSMYNLDFAGAHRAFHEWEGTHPQDPMGPVSDAAAYLFSEFDRLRVLQSEFFTEDQSFFARERALNPDPALKRQFEEALNQSQKLATARLAQSPDDENALLASVLRMGLHADYLALIEKRNFAALAEIKQSRGLAEGLLATHPQCYDAYLAVGVENYMLSL